MFDTLTESAGRRRSLRTALAATVIHGLLVAAAVSATQPQRQLHDDTRRDAHMLFVPPPPVVPSSPRQQATSLPSAPDVAALVMPPIPSVAPTGIAPTAMPDLAALTSTVPPAIPAVPAASAARDAGIGTGGSVEAALSADMVDEVVTVLRQRAPRYPRELERAGIGGRVVLEFVVDSAGRVEPASVRLLESSAEAFEAAAREAVLEARFRPARAAGHAVRQLVRQVMTFVNR